MKLTSSGRLSRTLVGGFLVTLLTLIAFSRFEGNNLHILSGLLLSWFSPGFVLMLVLYPKEAILSSKTVILSIVISFLLDILAGTLLDVLNLGLNESGFVIGLWLITMLLLTAGNMPFARRPISSNLAEPDKTYQPFFKWHVASDLKSVQSDLVVLFLFVCVLILTASWAFRVNLKAANDSKLKPFTVLAINPSDSDMKHQHFRITIDNEEGKSMVYRLEMRRNSTLVMEWRNIILDQKEQWGIEIPLSPFVGPTDFWLFKMGENEPYRQLHFIVP